MNCKLRTKNKERGFSFIEIILYMAIVTIVLSAIVPYTWTIIYSGITSSVDQEVSSSARYVSERIKYEIRNAQAIYSVTPISISLGNFDSSKNPTSISLSGGKVQIQQGTNPTIALHSVNTTVSSLAFTNYSSADNKTKHIGFLFTMQAAFPSVQKEFQESVTIDSSAELRSN